MSDVVTTKRAYAAVDLVHANQVYDAGDELVGVGDAVIEKLLERGDATASRPKDRPRAPGALPRTRTLDEITTDEKLL